MAQIIVRNLENDLKEALKRRAQRHGCSMEEEVRQILRRAVNEKLLADGERRALLEQRFDELVQLDLANRIAVFDVRAARTGPCSGLGPAVEASRLAWLPCPEPASPFLARVPQAQHVDRRPLNLVAHFILNQCIGIHPRNTERVGGVSNRLRRCGIRDSGCRPR